MYGRTPDPHTPLLVPGEAGPGTMSHQHTVLTGLPGELRSDDMLLWTISGFLSIAPLNLSPLFSLKAFHVAPAGCLQSPRRQQTELFTTHYSDTELMLELILM